jgi:myo-inositol 2-dehydrogenase/D-chiro-inositol 1-dehydrogenase
MLLQLAFERGGIGTIEVNADSGYGYEVMVEVTGEAGLITSAEAPSPTIRSQGSRSSPIAPDWLERFETAYLFEIEAWARSLAAGNAEGPSAWDGYISLAVAEAAIHSIETGQPEQVRAMDRPSLYTG